MGLDVALELGALSCCFVCLGWVCFGWFGWGCCLFGGGCGWVAWFGWLGLGGFWFCACVGVGGAGWVGGVLQGWCFLLGWRGGAGGGWFFFGYHAAMGWFFRFFLWVCGALGGVGGAGGGAGRGGGGRLGLRGGRRWDWLAGLHAAVLLVVPAVMLPFTLGWVDYEWVTRLDQRVYDQRLLWFDLLPERDERVVIVDVDEESLKRFGRWPWHRDVVGRLAGELLERQQVAVLGFDVLFAEPDVAEGEAALAGVLSARDARLAAQLRGQPVVLGFWFSSALDARQTGALPAPLPVSLPAPLPAQGGAGQGGGGGFYWAGAGCGVYGEFAAVGAGGACGRVD